jgi:Fic family protein
MLTVIRPSSMPRLWWLFPWSYAKTLHMSANAVKAYADRLDAALDIQKSIIIDQSAEIAGLRYRLAKLTDDVTRGTAIITDARPYHAASERLQDEAETRGDDLSSHE